MSVNDPRVEFRPSREARRKLESMRQEFSKRLGREVSLSELVRAIVEQFLFEEET